VIQGRGARHCAVEDCEISHIGTYAVWFDRGCTFNRIARNHIHDLGAGGVRFGEQGVPGPENVRTHHNVCTNNFIHDGGYVYAGAVGVWIGHASDNEVSHNEICDLNYTGISCGWSWGYGPTDHHNNLLAYNHLHHVGARGVLADTAAIYTLGISPGTRLDHNLIHDEWSYPPMPGAGGIYPDEGSSQITIENNVVYDTVSGGLTVHYGENNTVRNNIFAFGRDQQVVRGRNEEHLAFTFERNIVYYNSGATWVAGGANRNWAADHNLYFNASGQPLLFLGSLGFKEWQALGQDVHSLVADPRFVDPARRDFRLRPDSPALKLGFVPIDISTAGLTGPRRWTDLPRQIRRARFDLGTRPIPAPQLIDDGFENTPLGATADGAITYGQTPAATIRVTDETAATGKHSLKFLDAPGLDQSWNPHLWYTPNLFEGMARLQFDLLLRPGAQLWEEWRDSAAPYRVGPSLGIDAAGALTAGGRKIADLPADKWIHFDIVCGLGKKATATYSLTLTVSGAGPVSVDKLPCDPKFTHLEWLGFVSNATDTRIFYVDNIKLTVR
jgi:parallel beta-helix repeat protein